MSAIVSRVVSGAWGVLVGVLLVYAVFGAWWPYPILFLMALWKFTFLRVLLLAPIMGLFPAHREEMAEKIGIYLIVKAWSLLYEGRAKRELTAFIMHSWIGESLGIAPPPQADEEEQRAAEEEAYVAALRATFASLLEQGRRESGIRPTKYTPE